MQRFSTSLATVSRLLLLALLSCVMMGEVQAQTVCSAVYQDGAGTLQLCNNLILNNVSDIATNVYTIPSSNIIGDNTDIFTDNHLDFSIKRGSSAMNAGSDACTSWDRDLHNEKRIQESHVDVGAFEVFIIHENESYAVYQDRTGTLQLCNNLILNNGISWVTNVSPVLSNNIVGESSTIFVDRLSDFNIREGSAAMNAGDNDCVSWEQDITGGARIVCSIVDAGAYEVRNIVPDMTSIDETICEEAVYDFHGNGLSEEGDYTHTLTNAMGCDSIVTLHLTIHYGTHNVTDTTVCVSYTWEGGTGETYTVEDTYIYNYTDSEGCPCADTLHLSIRNVLDVTVTSTADTICQGESVTLQVETDVPTVIEPPLLVPPIAVGDVLCTDNSVVKVGDFAASGKTAKGVVFHVDNTGAHGWAVHLQDQAQIIAWCPANPYIDVSTLTNITTMQAALNDFDGYGHTQRIRGAGTAATFPAAYAVSFAQGWYIPAIGQLNVLFADYPRVNESLQLVGGSPLFPNPSGAYWSSSEFSDFAAFCIVGFGFMHPEGKAGDVSLRSVINF